jgi:hypothetical protein
MIIDFLKRVPPGAYAILGVVLVGGQMLTLYMFGQPPISASGSILWWVGDPLSKETSQQISDWYSLSHIIHGFLFFWLLSWIAPKTPLGVRILVAMGIEITWEIFENTPMVIEAYRAQALAIGYTGDSILNSLSDVLMMLFGFFVAWKFPAKYIIILAIVLELFTGFMIRDGLALNILNFAVPLESVHDWQAGLSTHPPE